MLTTNIKKNLHYTWKDKNIPEKYLKNINSWKEHLPEWNFIFWDDVSIDKLLKNENLKFKSKIQKIDYAKYFIVYNFGGLYIDIDVKLNKNIEKLLVNNNCVFFKELFEKNKEYYGPFLLYAKEKQKLYKELLLYIKAIFKINNIKNIEKFTYEVLYSTGPIMLDNFLKNKIFTGYDVETFLKYGIHYHDGNWFFKNKLINKLIMENNLNSLQEHYSTFQDNILKFTDKQNAAAGTRARKALLEIAKVSKVIRKDIQDAKNAAKE